MMRKIVIVTLAGVTILILVVLALQEDERRMGPRYPVPGSSVTR